MRSFINWNFAAEHVQVDVENGEYVSSESTLILGGPSRLSHVISNSAPDLLTGQTSLFPIGLLQNASMAQNRQVSRLFEIGSKRAYFVPGRLFANFTMNRILFFGPSLLRMLYAVAPFDEIGFGTPFTLEGQTNPITAPEDYRRLFVRGRSGAQLLTPPGYGAQRSQTVNRDFFINLSSELFNIPIGLCFIFKDANGNPYGATYLEECYIETHTMGVDSNNIVIAESATGQFDRALPVQVVAPSAAAA